jgi:hypothetical protein
MAVTLGLSQDDPDPQNPAYRRASHFSFYTPTKLKHRLLCKACM